MSEGSWNVSGNKKRRRKAKKTARASKSLVQKAEDPKVLDIGMGKEAISMQDGAPRRLEMERKSWKESSLKEKKDSAGCSMVEPAEVHDTNKPELIE